MKSEIVAEEILILMVYAFDLLARPTFRNWDQSYEGWLSRSGFLRRMQYLEKQKFLEREGKHTAWVYRLTKEGRELALGGRDPEAYWQRQWDGWWRQFVFDLPVGQQKARHRLIRWLRGNGFGYLQDSVWMSVDPVEDIAESLRPFREDAESFTILECHCAKGFRDASLVTGAWPFKTINEKYEKYGRFAADATKTLRGKPLHPRDLFALLRAERRMWTAAFDLDPLLPMTLWPKEYAGRRAWRTRTVLLSLLERHVQPK